MWIQVSTYFPPWFSLVSWSRLYASWTRNYIFCLIWLPLPASLFGSVREMIIQRFTAVELVTKLGTDPDSLFQNHCSSPSGKLNCSLLDFDNTWSFTLDPKELAYIQSLCKELKHCDEKSLCVASSPALCHTIHASRCSHVLLSRKELSLQRW